MQPLIAVALVLGLLWAAVRFLKARKLALPVLNRKLDELLGQRVATLAGKLARV